jgi:CubicO group peptidase (beta-lactamase class C family)
VISPLYKKEIIMRILSASFFIGMLIVSHPVAAEPAYKMSGDALGPAAQSDIFEAIDKSAAKFFVSQVQGGGKIVSISSNNPPPPHMFRFASLTKQMTAILVMQQVAKNKLKLDDTLGAYWPDFPNAEVRAVTIRQFLQHMSGIANTDDTPKTGDIPSYYLDNGAMAGNHQHAASTVCAGPRKAAPGVSFSYNNCDYLVIGAVLERLTGKSFAALLKEQIFRPAGMRTAGFYTGKNSTDGLDLANRQNLATYGAAGAAYGTLAAKSAARGAYPRKRLWRCSGHVVL